MSPAEIKVHIESKFPGSILDIKENSFPVTLNVKPELILPICEFLHSDSKTYFDHLSCLTGLDNGEEQGKMEVIYTLYSIPFDHHISLSVSIPRTEPKVDSVTSVWRGANWHEREAYDLLGIQFNSHPDLRRILLPDDWEGFPLRKDYEEQKEYHGLEVKWKGGDHEDRA